MNRNLYQIRIVLMLSLFIEHPSVAGDDIDRAVCNAYQSKTERVSCFEELGVTDRTPNNKGIYTSKMKSDECKYASSNPNDWSYDKSVREFTLPMDNNITVQTSYVFHAAKLEDQGLLKGSRLPCTSNCPYKHPSFNYTTDSVNSVLDYLSLPRITDLVSDGKKSYSSSSYSLGHITIGVERTFKGDGDCNRYIGYISIRAKK